MDFISDYLDETVEAFAAFREGGEHRHVMEQMAALLASRFRDGRKLLICGNGGSAADAQHIAGEIVGRLMYDRAPLPAIALTSDSAVITAIANDYGYDQVFERQVLGLSAPGDVLLAISTSGNSESVLRALAAARSRDVACLGFTGAGAGRMGQACELLLRAPSSRTSVIQQIHLTAAHVVCGLVERAMFPQS